MYLLYASKEFLNFRINFVIVIFHVTYNLYYGYKLLKYVLLIVTLCVRSVISHMVWVFFPNSEVKNAVHGYKVSIWQLSGCYNKI